MASVEYVSLGDDCGCTLATCPAFKASRRLARLQPRQAVVAAGKENPMSPFVMLVANATVSDPRYRRAGAASMFIRHILEGATTATANDRPHWDNGVVGLINVLSGINQDKSHVQDAAILRELHESYHNIIEVISKGFQFMSGTGEQLDIRKSIVAKMIAFFAYDAEMKRKMYDAKTLKIVIHCWLETPPDSPHRKAPLNAANWMLDRKDAGNPPPADYLHVASKAYKITTFISKINFNLKNKKLLGESLENEILLICEFLGEGDPYYPHVVEAKVHKQVALALRRHMKSDAAQNAQGTLDVLESGGIFVQNLLLRDDRMEIFTELLGTPHLFEAGVEGFKLANRLHPTKELAWYELFEKIQHTMTCTNRTGCPYHSTPAFITAAKACLERNALTTMRALEDDLGDDARYLTLWCSLMRVLGITRQSIRERYRVDKKCCSLSCPARLSGFRSEKKHTCTSCHAVFYCDRVCQKSDWEIHKSECESLC